MEQPDLRPSNDYQANDRAWNPCRPDIEDLLSRSEHVAVEPIYYGSNHTFLATVEAPPAGRSLAVYKPSRGEYPLYDFPAGSLYRREVGMRLLDRALGWDVVPPTVVTRGPYGVGSLQLFIEETDETEVQIAELQRIALLDVIANNADRKAEHCLVGAGGKLWGIDHGLTFHTQPKLRTVLWHFAGRPIPARELRALRALEAALARHQGRALQSLAELISRAEWSALGARVAALVDRGVFPDPRHKAVPYRW